MSDPHLSICIVNWNTRDLLKDCLESIYPIESIVEVIVVDNAADDSAAMVQAHFPAALLMSLNANEGFVGANNIAMGLARAPYWLLLNSDTRVEQGALGQLVAFMEKTPEAGAIGAKLLNNDGSLQMSCGIAPTFWSEMANKILLHKLFPFFKLVLGITLRFARSDGLQVPAYWCGARRP